MFFVPKMKYSLNGHVVSIQSASSGTSKPLLDMKHEIQQMVQQLTTVHPNECFGETGAPISRANVQLTTVLCNRTNGRADARSKSNQTNLTEITEQIISGIRRERSLININHSKRLIDFVFNFIP